MVASMVDPENLFDAKAQGLFGTMNCHAGRVGFRIPEYQRGYDWKLENIRRLLEDCLNGFANCWRSRKASYTFLGTIILVNERQSKERSFAGTSLAVVDGQQRLTTLNLLCCVLAEALVQRQDNLAPLRDQTREWIKDEISFHLDGLFACMIGQLPRRGSNFPFPRIVRNDDNRASNSHEAEYRSVVAKFFQEFAKFFAADSRSEFKPGGIPDNVQSKRLLRNYDFIREQVDLALCRVDEDETNYTLDFEQTGLNRFGSAGVRPLFEKLPSSDNASAQQSDQSANRALADVGNTPEVAPLVRLIAFSSYVTSCVVLTRVETDDDRYAFDIFDALNTTGEPLTAIETFRPRVIQYENEVGGFRDSESERHLNALADNLDRVYADTETRQRETKELLISLALYLNGEKLGLSLAAQRTYLRNVFDGYSRDEHGLAQRRRLVKSMANLAEFRFNYWDHDGIQALDGFHRSPQLGDPLKLCFSFLKTMGTSLTLPILARYWVSWRSGDLSEAEFLEAARAITAYVVLRRAVTGGTAGIDSELRRLMHPNPTTGGGPFCAGVNRHNDLVPVATLKTELRDRYLKKPCDAQDRNAWVGSASAVPLARRSRPLCRFLLLAAAHNALPDAEAIGLLTRTSVRRSENLDYLSFRRWVSHLYATVEHVAPDSDRGVAWDPAIYSDNIRHSLGNLILLPHTENTKIGNAEWSKKKLFYRALTAKTQDEKDIVMAQAKKQGLDFGKKTRQLFADNEQLAILESLDAVGTWDRSFIQLRGQRLLELAWDEIWSWLAAN